MQTTFRRVPVARLHRRNYREHVVNTRQYLRVMKLAEEAMARGGSVDMSFYDPDHKPTRPLDPIQYVDAIIER